jgi:hypothetical protein
MIRIRGALVLFAALAIVAGYSHKMARADEYTVEALSEAAPGDGVSKDIQDKLAASGVRMKRGADAFVDIWPAKEWALKPDFKEGLEIKFPFQPGELIGLIRYHKPATDFRVQDIKPGVYVIRAALQPVDGNHVGTSDTRDFFLLTKPADDTNPAPLEEKTMFKLSPKVAGGTHPTMLFIRKPGDVSELPAVKHDEEAERWSVVFAGKPQGGSGTLPVEVNLVGVAKE